MVRLGGRAAAAGRRTPPNRFLIATVSSASGTEEPAAAEVATSPLEDLATNLSLAKQAEFADAALVQPGGSREIWEDPHTLELLFQGNLAAGLSDNEKHRVNRLAKHYKAAGGKIHRVMRDGTLRLCPKPEDRKAIIINSHEMTGHFGVKRTISMVVRNDRGCSSSSTRL